MSVRARDLTIPLVRFHWDPEKDRANQEKHGISFLEAAKVFERREACLDYFDAGHSDLEERFITLGPVATGIVVVVWTERDGDVIRLISARRASPRERVLYVNEVLRQQ